LGTLVPRSDIVLRPSPVHGVLYGGSQAHTLSGNTTGSAGAARVLAATPPPPRPWTFATDERGRVLRALNTRALGVHAPSVARRWDRAAVNFTPSAGSGLSRRVRHRRRGHPRGARVSNGRLLYEFLLRKGGESERTGASGRVRAGEGGGREGGGAGWR
jgi:hypothetical protein